MPANILFKKILGLFLLAALLMATPSWGETSWQLSMSLDGSQSGMVMQSPAGFYLAGGGARLYISDSGNNRLLSYSSSGKFIHSFNASGKLESPLDMVKGTNGLLYVIEEGREALTIIDLKKKRVAHKKLFFDSSPILPGQLEIYAGNIFLRDKISGAVFRLNSNLQVAANYACSSCDMGFADFVVNADGVWAVSAVARKIFHFNLQGRKMAEIDLGAEINFPNSLALGPTGFLFVLDRSQGKILVYNESGRFKYSFLAKGNRSQKLYYPIEIRFDSKGRLWVLDEGNSRVEVYSR